MEVMGNYFPTFEVHLKILASKLVYSNVNFISKSHVDNLNDKNINMNYEFRVQLAYIMYKYTYMYNLI